MAEWKKNPVLGVVAAVAFILSIIIMVVLLQPRKATVKSEGEIHHSPASTPFIK